MRVCVCAVCSPHEQQQRLRRRTMFCDSVCVCVCVFGTRAPRGGGPCANIGNEFFRRVLSSASRGLRRARLKNRQGWSTCALFPRGLYAPSTLRASERTRAIMEPMTRVTRVKNGYRRDIVIKRRRFRQFSSRRSRSRRYKYNIILYTVYTTIFKIIIIC